MVPMLLHRVGTVALGFSLAMGLTGRPAQAALEIVVGARNVVPNEPVSSCDSKASRALTSVLGRSAEIGDTHEWEGTGAVDSGGNSFAAAAVHCYPLDGTGYVVTFTCAAQTPAAPEAASVICGQLADHFGGQP
ncbi:MAG: hypothetical protein WBE79_13630 [Candidatus Cybelea sp.]